MPLGLKMSQNVFFQRKVDQVFENCKGTVGIADDIQVFVTDDSHDWPLHEDMERAQKVGINLNWDKCIVGWKSCTFFGNIYTPQGVMSEPKNAQVIKQMQASSTKKNFSYVLVW